MEALINLIVALEKDNSIPACEYGYLSLDIPIVNDISAMAESLLITKSGNCDWENIELLKAAGYSAFAVERDSYGWLIGGISTDKGVITYG